MVVRDSVHVERKKKHLIILMLYCGIYTIFWDNYYPMFFPRT